MSRYTGSAYRRGRLEFREACRRGRMPCSICHGAIDYDLRSPHKWAWELHHIKPSSTHPWLHNVRSNWAAAHSRCNKSQANKPRPEWVRPAW